MTFWGSGRTDASDARVARIIGWCFASVIGALVGSAFLVPTSAGVLVIVALVLTVPATTAFIFSTPPIDGPGTLAP